MFHTPKPSLEDVLYSRALKSVQRFSRLALMTRQRDIRSAETLFYICRDKFAVVQFNAVEGLNEFSVVPLKWLKNEAGESLCSWPTHMKNIRTQIMKRTDPAENWKIYSCVIYNTFDTYEDALREEKKAAATSESEDSELSRPNGRRKIKPKKFSTSCSPPPLSDYEESGEASTSTSGNISDGVDNSEINSDCELNNNNVEQNTTNFQNAETNDITIINDMNNIPIIIDNGQYKELRNDILEIKSMVKIILKKINAVENVSGGLDNILDDEKIKKILPIKTIEDLLSFEGNLEDDDMSKQLQNKLTLVGGSNYKNLIRRCLPLLLEDNLAIMCSWTGQKDNFKVGDLKIFEIFKKAVKTNFTITDKEFELVVMEWLRFAKQRKARNSRQDS